MVYYIIYQVIYLIFMTFINPYKLKKKLFPNFSFDGNSFFTPCQILSTDKYNQQVYTRVNLV